MRSTKLPSWIEGLFGLAPVSVPPHVFGLAVDRLDYGRFEASGAGLELKELRSLPLAPGTFQAGLLGGPLAEPAAFREQLMAFVDGISVPVKSASLVLPDSWVRVAFAESEELPKAEDARDEVLRWKLKRLVPFRVEELRVEATEVAPLAGQTEPKRLMLAFGVETLLSQLESVFEGAGIWLGQIGSASLSLLGSVAGGPGLNAIALVEEAGYTLIFAHDGEPVLHRFKAVGENLPLAARSSLVGRDLRLTRNFLEQQLPGTTLNQALVAAPPEVEEAWVGWLTEGLDCPVESISERHLPLSDQWQSTAAQSLPASGLFSSWSELAPLVGAAAQEVA